MKRDRERPSNWATWHAQNKHRRLLYAPYVFEWSMEWLSYSLGRWAFIEVLEYAGKFTVLVAAIIWLLESGVFDYGLTSQQREAIAKFSEATSEFSRTTASYYSDLPQAVSDINVQVLALSPGQSDADFEGPFGQREMETRISDLILLDNYAYLLETLADNSSPAELNRAAANWMASVRVWPIEDHGISDGELARIGNQVANVQGFWTNNLRRRVIEEVVSLNQKNIERVGKFLVKELGPDGPIPAYMDVMAFTLEKRALTPLEDQTLSSTERALHATALRNAETVIRQTQAVYPKIEEAVQALVAAHEVIATSFYLENWPFDKVIAFVDRVSLIPPFEGYIGRFRR